MPATTDRVATVKRLQAFNDRVDRVRNNPYTTTLFKSYQIDGVAEHNGTIGVRGDSYSQVDLSRCW